MHLIPESWKPYPEQRNLQVASSHQQAARPSEAPN